MSLLSRMAAKESEHESKKAQSFERRLRRKRMSGWISIIVLATVDFFTMLILFSDGLKQLHSYELASVCLVIVSCLEGLPAYLGIAVHMCKDKKRIDINDKTNAWVAIGVCAFGTLLIFVLVVVLRLSTPMVGAGSSSGSLESLRGGKSETNMAQIVLAVLPLATSMLTFAISWHALGADRLVQQEYKVDIYYEKYEYCRNEFYKSLGGLRNARIAIWTALDATSKVPRKLHVFYKEIYAKACSKIIEDSLVLYPVQLSRFNSAVRGELEVFIGELCARSTVPYAISDIDIDGILAEYDKFQIDNDRKEDIWDCNKSMDTLKTELQQILDNAVVVAQCRTYRYFPLEEEGED